MVITVAEVVNVMAMETKVAVAVEVWAMAVEIEAAAEAMAILASRDQYEVRIPRSFLFFSLFIFCFHLFLTNFTTFLGIIWLFLFMVS